MDDVITRNNLGGTYSYVDNIVVTGKTQEEHDKNFSKFLEGAKLHKLTFNEKKFFISASSLNFLGYTISYGVLPTDTDRLRLLKELSVSKGKR